MRIFALPILVLTFAASAANAAGDPTSEAMSACMTAALTSYNNEQNVCMSKYANAPQTNISQMMQCIDYARAKRNSDEAMCLRIIGN
jgi:ABC-type transporter MlaC component